MSIFFMLTRVLWLVVIVVLLYFAGLATVEPVLEKSRNKVLIKLFRAIALILCMAPLIVEYVSYDAVRGDTVQGKLVRFDRDTGAVNKVIDEGFMLCTGNCAHVPVHTFVEMSVSFITDDPMVRSTNYTMDVTICDYTRFFKRVGKPATGYKVVYKSEQEMRIRKEVEFELYEFSHAFGSNISKFYNPHDPFQRFDLEREILKVVGDNFTAMGLCASLDSWTVN